jgi:hypothetical protein
MDMDIKFLTKGPTNNSVWFSAVRAFLMMVINFPFLSREYLINLLKVLSHYLFCALWQKKKLL